MMSSLHVGRHLVIGFEGKVLNEDLKLFLEKIRPSGIIFFSRNIDSALQLRSLIRQIRDLLGEEVFFTIDHECGLVQRLEDGFTPFPGNMALGKVGSESWAQEQGCIMGHELRSLGIDVNLAPVLDVLTPTLNPGITIRSFGQDPAVVSTLGCALMMGMQSQGVGATAKHFPGKGAATVDAHEDLPFVNCSFEEMKNIHLQPFQKVIRSGISFVMTSHVVYSAFEKELPATFSKKIVTDLLRKELDFKNVIFSDDLEMGAILRRFPFEEAVVRAVEVGHDLVLICHQKDLVEKGYHALEEAYEKKRLKWENLEKSVLRLKTVLKDLRKAPLSVGKESGSELAQKISEKSVEFIHTGSFRLSHQVNPKPLILVPDFSSVQNKYFFELALLENPSFFSKTFSSYEYDTEEFRVDLMKDNFSEKLEKFSKNLPVIMFCFDAVHLSFQKELLLKLQQNFSHLAVVLLRNPYDEQFVNSKTTCIQTYGFRTPQIHRAIQLLCGMSS